MLAVLEETRPHVVLGQMWERRNPVDLGWGRSEAKPVHPLQGRKLTVDGRACSALLLAIIHIAGDEVTGNVHSLQSAKERLKVELPSGFNVIEAPASIDPVISRSEERRVGKECR